MADLQALDDRQPDVSIVAVGASAGGITALQKLFEGLPSRLPFALVILQHLPPGRPSGLGDLITKWTSVPIRSAQDGARPEPNAIYLPSPDDILTLENGVFRTRPAAGGNRRPGIDTIDTFLESLALKEGSRPVAVILSGTGMDGTAGAIRIRQADGIVIVQDPLTALHDGMPNAVIQRGIHDHVLPARAIGQQLAACAEPAYTRPVPSADWTGTMSETFGRIIGLIRQRVGFDLSGYKPSPLLWRIQQRMDIRKVWSFDDYALLIEDDPVELEALVRGIPIHVTEFFRDADAWTALRKDVLEPLVRAAHGARAIRTWTPACSTGEEAYSVAMLLDEVAQENGVPSDFQAFASDAAPELVARASRGLFSAASLAAVPASQRSRYFYMVDGAFRIKRQLREKMVFAPQDLVADPPFSGLDLITCRNLFIYLEPETVREVLFLLHGSLRQGGFLFLGKSEATSFVRQGFEAVSRQWSIYRKTGPIPEARRKLLVRKPVANGETLDTAAIRAALEQYDVPSVLTDDEGSVLRIYGNTRHILGLPAGEPSLRLIDLVPRPWAAPLRSFMQLALEACQPMTLTGLTNGVTGEASMTVRITPLQTSADGAWRRMLVSFIGDPHALEAPDAGDEQAVPVDLSAASAADWKDEARVSREELEASREELQALNEELKASNQQLNESNDGLNDANVDLQANIAQLAMQNRVLLSGAVMALFLDETLKLRWFTPSMREVLPLTACDTGRHVADLVPKFRDRDFYTDIQYVLDTREPREATVRNSGGQCFLRKTFPYIAETGSIAGVAITYADITDRTRADAAQRRNETSQPEGSV
ncbi:CheR family methyltransferase [Paraburkholderia phymatum]|uniref:MCP methyltransferase, CheR-type n=1 Tax=Paraburkholderia phymatum (strain DSM 17167 / CIP 108236 / LMG 21445 / STM815) TaxID=391038 RepID=B2JMC6_PARP8|nr:CheR family methyltransferase [Paraburkholderia phymatum]ACC74261.1 MCP methyltransferase, CheR-type [Paraburkholderia phymatum STM815]